MTLEAQLERIATALETIAANGGVATPADPKPAGGKSGKSGKSATAAAPADPAPAAGDAAPETAVPKKDTVEDAQKIVGQLVGKNREVTIQLLGRYNAKKASDVKDIPGFMAEARELLETLS